MEPVATKGILSTKQMNHLKKMRERKAALAQQKKNKDEKKVDDQIPNEENNEPEDKPDEHEHEHELDETPPPPEPVSKKRIRSAPVSVFSSPYELTPEQYKEYKDLKYKAKVNRIKADILDELKPYFKKDVEPPKEESKPKPRPPVGSPQKKTELNKENLMDIFSDW